MNGSSIVAKKSIEKNFIIVPREEYKEFSFWKKAVKISLDEKWFWTPEWQKKEAQAEKAIRSGKISPLFSDHKELVRALKNKKQM